MNNLCEELGDVLLQVLLYSQIASETGSFTIHEVVDGISRKMIRRHPHVFGDAKVTTKEEGLALWESVKKREKDM
jgi:tetrapyrrole methylase family protein/MazG family protein